MNPLFHHAAGTMNDGTGIFMGAITVAFIGIFVAWTWYAYAPSRAALMERYGSLPFDDGE